MKTSEKITISLPEGLIARIERIRKKTGETRSSVLKRFVVFSLQQMDRRRKARRQVDGYLRMPEHSDDWLLTGAYAGALWDEEAPY